MTSAFGIISSSKTIGDLTTNIFLLRLDCFGREVVFPGRFRVDRFFIVLEKGN